MNVLTTITAKAQDAYDNAPTTPRKFEHPDITAKGEVRASVPLKALETLWINTGTLCNIECRSCYIESSPTNDRLEYMTRAETASFLAEAKVAGTREIGFTGGEPFLNPDMPDMLDDALAAGFEVLLLTNAMRPMQRPRILKRLLATNERWGGRLSIRVSVDHYTKALHETERGPNTWAPAMEGLDWLAANGFNIAIAGRTCWNETDGDSRAGYAGLIAEHGWAIDPEDRQQLMLLPEMDEAADVPEITTACWDILHKTPDQMMCSTSRMVVKRKGADEPAVLPCTLLPFDERFEMGPTLESAEKADGGMFAQGAVKLCHPHCARFCVLGGGSCS